MNELLIWGVVGVLFAVVVVIVLVVERSRNKHQTLGEAAAAERDSLRAKYDALQAELISYLKSEAPKVQAKVQQAFTKETLDNDLERVKTALAYFKAKGADLDSFFERVWQAQITPDGKLVMPPVADLPLAAGVTGPTGVTSVAMWELPPVLIDRDDLMKHITTDFPQPVVLDGRPVHNGIGDAINYYTWPDGGGLRIDAPPKKEVKNG